MRTLGWILWMFGYMISRIPATWRARRMIRQGRADEANAIISREVSMWAKRLLDNIQITLDIHGRENLPEPGDTVVYVANHQSYIDIPILFSLISPPPAIMAKRELARIPILGFWMRQLGCVIVDRDDARSGMEAIKDSQATLAQGNCFAIFPEGTRSKTGKIGEFQAGAVHIAAKAGVPIIPIVISGSFRGFEGNGNRLKPAAVCIEILPKVETQGLTRTEKKALPSGLAGQIGAALTT